MPTSDVLVDKGDEALRLVGTVELWKNVVVAVLLVVACVVGIVVLVRYHAGWTSGTYKVTRAQCAPATTDTTCSQGGSCTTHRVAHCSRIEVEGFSTPFVAQYVEPATPPAVGSNVKVFYDPSDKTQAFLAHGDFVDDYKSWILGFLVVAILGFGFSAWFQFSVKGSRLAQRVAGGAAVFNMAM